MLGMQNLDNEDRVQGHFQLLSKCAVNLGYMRPHLKKKKRYFRIPGDNNVPQHCLGTSHTRDPVDDTKGAIQSLQLSQGEVGLSPVSPLPSFQVYSNVSYAGDADHPYSLSPEIAKISLTMLWWCPLYGGAPL